MTSEQLLLSRMVGATESCFAMEWAMLQALGSWMKFISKKEPEGAMLNEHIWALVLQHLDTLQDHVRAATSCRAAWKAGILKLDIPVHMPSEGTYLLICNYRALSVSHIKMTGSVFICS